MKVLFAVLVLMTSFRTFSNESGEVLIFSNNKTMVEKQIKERLKQFTGIKNLEDFNVDWSSLKCMPVKPSEMEPKPASICAATVSAFQVTSLVAIVKGTYTSVVIIHADVEQE